MWRAGGVDRCEVSEELCCVVRRVSGAETMKEQMATLISRQDLKNVNVFVNGTIYVCLPVYVASLFYRKRSAGNFRYVLAVHIV